MQAVEAIVGEHRNVLDPVQGLVDQSLVVSADGRMRLLVPIRAFATAQLKADSTLAEETLKHHRVLYAQMGDEAGLRAAECSTALARRLVEERHNLVVACERSVNAGDIHNALKAGHAAVEGLRAGANHAACLVLAERLGTLDHLNPTQRLQVELIAVRSLHEVGRRAEALHRLEQTSPCAEASVDAIRACLLGEFRHLNGQEKASESALTYALQRTENGEWAWTHAVVLSTAARVAAERGQTGLARQQYEACLSLLSAQGRRSRLAPVAVNFANLNRDDGHFDEAIRWYDQAISSAEQSGAQRVQAVAQCNRAALFADYGRFPAAESGFKQGISRLRHMGDNHFEGIFLGMASELYIGMGQLDLAEQALTRAHACHSQLEQSLWMRVIQGRFAVLDRARGRFDLAISALEGLLPLLKDPLPHGYGLFLSHLAQARAQAGDMDGAVRDFAGAQEALGSGRWTADLALCLAGEARFLAPFRPERAEAALEEAKHLQSELCRPQESTLGRAIEAAETAQRS
jgi:tetratricopeptide (TPR) repeat protein